MNKIIKCNLGVQYVAEDADAKNIYVTIIYYDDCLKRRERVRLTYTNIMQLLSSWGACQVEGGCFMAEDFYNPGGRKDLGWVVSLVLNEAYHFNMITKEEYLEKVRSHFEEYYMEDYRSRRKRCSDFYNRHFPERTKRIYKNYEEVIEHYSQEIEEKAKHRSRVVGGEFYGCYMDSQDRCRPLTRPKRYISYILEEEKLWVCFTEELLKAVG